VIYIFLKKKINRSLFFNWLFIKVTNKSNKIILNFGPQHPAAHGVLRLILQLNNEIIEKMDIHIGLLHRGTEFLITQKHYEKSIPYFDRLDYVSMITQEHAYCLTIEKLMNITNVDININFIRILFDELTRILNHFLAIACHALDVGSMSSIFWGFEERENIMEFYERVSGARMHAAFHTIYLNDYNYLNKNLINDISFFINNCFKTLNEMHNVLTYNKIWKQRLINIGVINLNDCQNYSLTGVLARSVGLKKDLRISKLNSYSNYNFFKIKSYLGINGDTYDRYLIRMLEMGESLNLINTILLYIKNKNNFKIYQNLINSKIVTNKNNTYTNMEDLITHFLKWHNGIYIKKNLLSNYIESPKGEFGTIIISNNTNKPYKCKIRSPSYFNLQALSKFSKGHFIADLSALIGTIDIVFGEIDR